MAETTTNYKLKKPTDNENADIADINDNMDIIDAALKEISKGADKKFIGKVLSPTGGNIPTLTADGQLSDSGKSISDITVTVDTELSETSTNPVQNKAISAALKKMGSGLPNVSDDDSYKTLIVNIDGEWVANYPTEWTVTVPVSGWSETTTDGWYTNQITVEGMKTAYNPIAVLSITSAELADEEQAEFANIKEIETHDGYIICKALATTGIDINIRMAGV